MTNDIESFTGSDLNYPAGAIIMWEGGTKQIPHGWLFCDGNNGTPDMRNRVAMSVPDTATDPGAIVGQDSYAIAEAQLPAHSHSGSTSTDNAHIHGGMNQSGGDSDDDTTSVGDGTDLDPNGNDGSRLTRMGGAHAHGISTGYSGSGNSVNNKPKEQTVNFIQKT